MKFQRGIAWLPVLLLIGLVLGGGAYLYTHSKQSTVVSVTGMTKYVDNDFGFSFWYPSGWTIDKGNWKCSNLEPECAQDGQKYIDVAEGKNTQFRITESTNPEDQTGSGTTTQKTMGGLEVYSIPGTNNAQVVVSLGHNKSLTLSGGSNVGFLAHTVAPLDPSIATPVSVSEQIKTIQAEKDAYTKPSANSDFVPLADGQQFFSPRTLFGYQRKGSVVSTAIYDVPGSSIAHTVDGADASTFEVNKTWSIYARDASHVYVEGSLIPNANPSSFVALCGEPTMLEAFCAYGKDSKHVYAYTQIIPDADPATFVSLLAPNAKSPYSGKLWTDIAADASAVYQGYVPVDYGNFSHIQGTRISILADGTPIHLTDTTHIIAVNNNTAWGGYYYGVQIGTKSYYGGEYFVDGNDVYTIYSACDIEASGKEGNCKNEVSRVDKIGDKPAGL